MYVKLTIPERLQDLRKERHLTLEQLAEQTGLSKSALGKYETDDYKGISPFAIATLANFYGVSTDYLLGLSENKNHPSTELQALHLSDDTALPGNCLLPFRNLRAFFGGRFGSDASLWKLRPPWRRVLNGILQHKLYSRFYIHAPLMARLISRSA